MLAHPKHPLAGRRRATIEEVGQQTVIAHNDPSPARERVLRAYEHRHTPINIQVALPSLDGIKRAVEMGMGVARAAAPLRAQRDRQRDAGRDQGARPERAPPGPSGLPACETSRMRPRRFSISCGQTAASAVEGSYRPVALAPHVGQTCRDGFDFLVPVEQQAGRIPAAVEKAVSCRRGHGDGEAVSSRPSPEAQPDRRRPPQAGSRVTIWISGLDRLRRGRHARQTERDRVAEEDLRERFADDRADPAAPDRLRRVLARRSAAEVRVDHEDRRARRSARSKTGAARALRVDSRDRPRTGAPRGPRT